MYITVPDTLWEKDYFLYLSRCTFNYNLVINFRFLLSFPILSYGCLPNFCFISLDLICQINRAGSRTNDIFFQSFHFFRFSFALCSPLTGTNRLYLYIGIDVVLRVDDRALSSAAVIGIVVGCVLLLLLVIDILCCLIGNLGLLAMMCRRTKRSPSDLGDEEKLGR